MIPLLISTDKIRVISGQTGTVDCLVSWANALTTTAPPVVQNFGAGGFAITTATTTDVVTHPGTTNLVRTLDEMHITNKHASTSMDITVVQTIGGTDYVANPKVTLAPGWTLQYNETYGFFTVKPEASEEGLIRILDADATGTNGTAAQPWFPTNGAVTVAAATTYHMSGELSLSRTAGTTGHTTSILFGGTATLTSIYGGVFGNVGETDLLLPQSRVPFFAATAVVAKASSTTASEKATFLVHGVLRTNAAGTFIPQFKYDVAPGGAPTIRANSHFELEPVGTNTFTAQGTWT
jgi:hypothetical protein